MTQLLPTDDDLSVYVVQVETTGLWEVGCCNSVCSHLHHEVGQYRSKGHAEAAAKRHRLHIRRETTKRAERASDTVTIPRDAYLRLVKVAAYVSRGLSFVGVDPYPDAAARFALGALDNIGLIPEGEGS
ncbi:hypothetical protein ACIBH1_05555 [Nonomuraea sp. NPDC050663]|uniref:hypothetical protein n=1 Tax=Nonomuraea sp. NPDC050663 TaxID=3364370 RepID=UPI0037ACD346